MNHTLRRSCRIQLVADTLVIAFLLTIQIVLVYLLWMKDHFFIPPELLIAGFIETVLVTLLLQVIATIQLLLIAYGIYGFCTHRVKYKDHTGYRVDVKDLFFGVLYIPLCVCGAFLTATASRPWHTKPLEGGAEIFVRILPLALVVFIVIPGVYAVYHGSQSPLLRSSPRSTHPTVPPAFSPETGIVTRDDLKLVVMPTLLLPLYTLLIIYPYGPFILLQDPEVQTVIDMNNLMAIITLVLALLTGSGIVLLLCAMGFQGIRRRRCRETFRLQQEVNLDILREPP